MLDLVDVFFLHLGIVFSLVTLIIFNVNTRNAKYWCMFVLILGILFTFNEGYEYKQTPWYSVHQEKLIVSSSPSSLKTEGIIGGNFLFFSGYVSQSRYYLLREQIEEGLYKDFEVNGEVYLRESVTFLNQGKYTEEYHCYDKTESYTLFWKTWTGEKEQHCDLKRQEIIVPVDSIIKEISL